MQDWPKSTTVCIFMAVKEHVCITQMVLPPNWLCSEFLEPRWYLANVLVFPHVLIRIIVIKDTSSMEGVCDTQGSVELNHPLWFSKGTPVIFPAGNQLSGFRTNLMKAETLWMVQNEVRETECNQFHVGGNGLPVQKCRSLMFSFSS